MKTKLTIILFIVAVISPQLSFSQKSQSFIDYLIRGHGSEDLYIQYYSGQVAERHLYYFNHNGSHLQYTNPYWDENKPVAEIIPGQLISLGGLDFSFWYQSTDYGNTKVAINIAPGEYIILEDLFGGEYPGAYIIQAQNFSNGYPTIYETYFTQDYGSNYTLIDDSVNFFRNPEVGSLQGEMYQLPIIDGHGFVCRSIDYSLTFDTTAIDTNILNENLGLNFAAISHGSTAGDLFLVIKDNNVMDAVMYHVYHSTDYGHSWQLKSDPLIDDPDVKFTAGRASCSFYIAHSHLNAGDDYNTLYIEYSNDCGATFTTYSYLMTPDVANEKPDKAESFATVTPNPAADNVAIQFANIAKQVKIKILSTEGKEVSVYDNINGNKNFNISVNGLSSGVYLVQFLQDGTLKQVSKLIVAR